jgi:flagellar basal-body rod protein FlgB
MSVRVVWNLNRKNCEIDMLEGINLFRLAGGRMEYLAQRQSVIARNIANADTPGYVSRDLTPFDSALAGGSTTGATGATAGLTLVRTYSDHLGGTTTAASATVSPVSSYGEKPDGNGVSIEEQMIKSADNTSAYALVSAAYAKSIEIMKMSIDK